MNDFDLSALDSIVDAQENGVDIEILHPGTGEPLGMKFHVVGQDSKPFIKARRKVVSARMGKRAISRKDPEKLERDGLETLACCVVSWSTGGEPGIKLDGEVLDCNPENVMKVFERFPFIREQVDEVVGDRAAFLTK